MPSRKHKPPHHFQSRRDASPQVRNDGILPSQEVSVQGEPLPPPQFRDRLRVLELEFGVLCREEQILRDRQPTKGFSIEFKLDCREEDCYLLFDDFERNIRIKLGGHTTMLAQCITLAIRTIDTIEDDGIWVMLSLTAPPSFETESNFPPLNHQSMVDKKFYRTRRTSLLDRSGEPLIGHARIAPYSSQILRVRLFHGDVDNFHNMAELASLPRIRELSHALFDASSRDLFSQRNLERLESWLCTLPWPVAFQCQALLSNGFLNPLEILHELRPKVAELLKGEQARCVDILRHLGVVVKRDLDNKTLTSSCSTLFNTAKHEFDRAEATTFLRVLSDSDHMCAQVTFTPTGMRLSGPFPDMSNRVLRMFPKSHDHFIRVNFADEDLMTYRYNREVDSEQYIYPRIRQLLVDGFKIGNRDFEFLGYSASSLKEHSVWFINPFYDHFGDYWDAETIRSQLGDFTPDDTIYCPARYGARIAQTFSATEPSITIDPSEFEAIEDIISEETGSCFTDGVGTISPELAEEVWTMLCASRRTKTRRIPPSAYQIRIGGHKGVVVRDHTLSGRKIRLRPSMSKFDADSTILEISMSFERPMTTHLNRQLIMLLESNGVPKDVFLELQRRAVQEANAAMDSPDDFIKVIETYGLGHSFALSSLVQQLASRGIIDFKGFKDQDGGLSGFFQRIAKLAVSHTLRDLKHHARIPVPESCTLVGVADEWNYLEEGQVYACVWHPRWDEPRWIEGEVLISRSPTVHPGDAQIAEAIGKPPPGSPFEIDKLPNVLVFSCKGERALPSCLGGGDLDGDIYSIIGYLDLHPIRAPDPADYPKGKRTELKRPSTIEDIADFVVEYIISDMIGLIATNHLIISDMSDQGPKDPDCIDLCALHSQAVDYVKTGTAVQRDEMPKLRGIHRPDWSAGELRDPRPPKYYESNKAIGHLFRDIEIPEPARAPLGPPIPEFAVIPVPPVRWPTKLLAEERLHVSQYPAPPPAVSQTLSQRALTPRRRSPNPPATTIKIVRNEHSVAPKPSAWSKPLTLANSNSSVDGSLTTTEFSLGTSLPSPTFSSSALPGPTLPPGLGPPPGLALPPGLPLAPGALPATPRPSMPTTPTPPVSTHLSDAESVLKRLRECARPFIDLSRVPDDAINVMREAYGRYIIDMQNVSVAQALGERLTEEELVIGTINVKSQAKRRKNIMYRMRALTSRLVVELRRIMTGNDSLGMTDRLLMATAAYLVAAEDAEKSVWGASGMCLVALAGFCEALVALEGQQKDSTVCIDEVLGAQQVLDIDGSGE